MDKQYRSMTKILIMLFFMTSSMVGMEINLFDAGLMINGKQMEETSKWKEIMHSVTAMVVGFLACHLFECKSLDRRLSTLAIFSAGAAVTGVVRDVLCGDASTKTWLLPRYRRIN